MREILFRGKRIDKGDWVEGSLVVAGDYCCILPADENSVHPTEYPYLNPEIGTIDGHLFPVDPLTVGQYTGLTDKNGKKIFEGDMLLTSQFGSVWYNATVEWKKGAFLVVPHKTYPHAKMTAQIGWLSARLTEVVGNIHDNPELLEVNDGNDTH